MPEKEPDPRNFTSSNAHATDYLLAVASVATVNHAFILKHTAAEAVPLIGSSYEMQPDVIGVNEGIFNGVTGSRMPAVKVVQFSAGLWFSCACTRSKTHLCEHQAQVLQALITRPEFRVFFDAKLRRNKILPVAQDYGLAAEENLDKYFDLEYANKNITVKPKLKELLPVNPATQAILQEQLLPKLKPPMLPQSVATTPDKAYIVVIAEHKYYKHLYLELYRAAITASGKLKNPLQQINPADLIWLTENPEELKFFTAITKFQRSYEAEPGEADLAALKALVRNPLGFKFYQHNLNNNRASGNITASSLVPVAVQSLPVNLVLDVVVKDNFYEITGTITLLDQPYDLQHLAVQHEYFIQVKKNLYLLDNPDLLRIIRFFKKHNHKILIHESKFAEFRETVLASLESKIKVNYAYIKPATPKQIEEFGLAETREQIIYLSESEDFILLTPVMKYGPLEIPVLTHKQLYGTDARGQAFTLARDEEAEHNLVADILKQHPFFYEQLHQDCFYLHRDRFLEDGWFLDAFEAWQQAGITVLGFKELKNNRLNPHKAKISIQVTSGINWFDTTVKVKFGQQQASLKYLHQAIRNKSKFVQLGDGTQGLLPQEWLEKFARYLAVGEVAGEHIRTPKINYSVITELYEDEVLSQEVQTELIQYRQKLANYKALPEAEVPAGLHATLRGYQKQGLNWLTFLDEFNFGGCLADDMGLGKTIQILAFLLAQRGRVKQNTNLVVVPTSLLFNWQDEVARFAPSLKILTVYGATRIKNIAELNQYEIVLTSYGTLLSDIRVVKEYPFNYIILDESQNIKNPETERYRAVRLLQSRNKLVLTGTPIENNTFDLYGQLSFACPGLLGSKRFFRDHYSTPIDKFKDSRRAAELQQKVSPFILRRTKEQVAPELPDKTEMVIYCEMGAEQRRVYDAAEREIRDFISAQGDGEILKNSMHVLTGLTQLRQICNSPALLTGGDYSLATSAKIETLLEQIQSKAPHHKILVFSQFVTMLELIKKELSARGIPFALLTGQTRDRAAAVNQFQDDANVRVFLISLKAGGTGLNLTRADYVYLVEPWWNPAVENQAIDRVYRIGQEKHVVAIRLICPNTVEEKIQKLQESKKELVKEMVETDNAVLKSLSKKELLGLFS
ncbi:DEAD/DEAH box helicase [Adhaeribacter rhizoryzae]|uniref:ATP-dependent helicase n=1 Tax=Adhaeribacter rhizoryzae TaxID=2607907 RepID=A0A5M6DJ86_9BACT|nr:DEAD/DEAH box helicase [Adhaeribacter rhizoryzae]KAA5547513.1 ATP-dependent helicase [Adhaeribacter rhizoryzae]